MSDLVREAAVAWRDWDRKPASPDLVAARERAVGALAESLGVGTAVLTALVQEARREGQGPDEALRRIVEPSAPHDGRSMKAMVANATLTVTLADLPEVKALVEGLTIEVDNLRHLVQQWEPRVACPQCGERYARRACGPTHAIVKAMVDGPEPTDRARPTPLERCAT